MQMPDLEVNEASSPAFYARCVERATLFMESHISEQILLDDIAAYAGLSPYHFHRIFKAVKGETTRQYLIRIRLELAAHLLTHTTNEVAAIGLMAGYDQPEVFSRAFKQYFEVSPSVFRQQAGEQIGQRQQTWAHLSMEDLQIGPPVMRFVADTAVACIRHTGSYDQVGKTWNRLMLWALTHLQVGFGTQTLGIVHDNPDITDTSSVRYDACIVLKKPAKPQGIIQPHTIPGGKYAVFRYKGPYDRFYEVYDYLYLICLRRYGYRLRHTPALEWYIQSPPFYQPRDYVTDFYLPIE